VDCDRIDAAVSLTSREIKEKQNDDDFFEVVETNHVYIFSRDQYYRYASNTIDKNTANTAITIEAGYPKSIRQLKFEPRFKELKHNTSFMAEIADGIDAVMSDERNVYLFKGNKFQVLSDHCDANTHEFNPDIKALIQEWCALYAIEQNQWSHISSLDGTGGIVIGGQTEVPLWLSNLPSMTQGTDYSDPAKINAVLKGTDHKTYIFSDKKFLNKQLNREYDKADHGGKVRNNIYDNNHIDAAFTGIDNKLYLFSGDQYYVYMWDENDATYKIYTEDGNDDDTGVHSIADKWHGLDNVNIAYRLGDKTYLCEKPDSSG
jgi:hypothetical protein